MHVHIFLSSIQVHCSALRSKANKFCNCQFEILWISIFLFHCSAKRLKAKGLLYLIKDTPYLLGNLHSWIKYEVYKWEILKVQFPNISIINFIILRSTFFELESGSYYQWQSQDTKLTLGPGVLDQEMLVHVMIKTALLLKIQDVTYQGTFTWQWYLLDIMNCKPSCSILASSWVTDHTIKYSSSSATSNHYFLENELVILEAI